MKLASMTLAVAVLLTACSEEPTENETSVVTPSPLISTDKDRLWIVLSAGPGVKLYCNDYYQSPEDPRYAGDKARCTAWELDAVDHLKINGFPNIQVEHLRDPALFTWWRAYFNETAECAKGKFGKEKAFCDPYRKALQENGRDGIGVNYVGSTQ